MIPTDFIFLFIIRVVVFLWSELIRVQFYFIFIFLFDPSWSESIRVDPTRTGGPSWSGPTFVRAYLFPKTEAFCHFTFFYNFSCFSTTATERTTSVIKIPLLCFVNLGFGRGKRRNRGSMAVFVVHAGFYRRVKGKTKAFLTSLTSFQELHLMWVWVIAFVVSFNSGHNYLKFLTVTV